MASRVKIVKWFLVGSLCLFCSAVWVRGDAAADLYNQGLNDLNNAQFDDAAKVPWVIEYVPTLEVAAAVVARWENELGPAKGALDAVDLAIE